jgi:carbonic anhydrase
MTQASPQTLPSTAILPAHLVEGYETFLTGRFGREQERFRVLAEKGQSPNSTAS